MISSMFRKISACMERLRADREAAAIAAFFILTAGVFHFRELILGGAYIYSDNISNMARLWDIYGSGEGVLSSLLWTPSQMFGFSYIREGGALAMHFPECLALQIFAPFTAIALTSVFWTLVSLFFTFKLARAFGASRPAAVLGAVAYSFSGTISREMFHYDQFVVMASAPAVFYCAERFATSGKWFWAALSALLAGNGLLNSHPQYASYLFAAVFAYALIRCDYVSGPKEGGKRLLVFGLFLALGCLVGAVFLLPFFDQISGSITAGGRDPSYSILDLTAGMGWLKRLFIVFLAPLSPLSVGGDMPHAIIPSMAGHSWSWTVYIGLLPCFMWGGILPKENKKILLPLFFLSAMGLWMLLPALIPCLDLRSIYALIPGFNKFHYFERGLFIPVFSMSILLALAADSFSKEEEKPAVWPVLAAAGWMITAIMLACWARCSPASFPLKGLFLPDMASLDNFIRHAGPGSRFSFLAVACGALLYMRFTRRVSGTRFLWVAACFTFVELAALSWSVRPLVKVSEFLTPPKLAAFIPKDSRYLEFNFSGSWVMERNTTPMESRTQMASCINIFYGLREAGGMALPIFSGDEYSVLNLLLANCPMQGLWVFRDLSAERWRFSNAQFLWRKFGISRVLTNRDPHVPGLVPLADDGYHRIYEVRGTAGSVYVASSLKAVPDFKTLSAELLRGDDVFSAYVQDPVPGPVSGVEGKVSVIKMSRTNALLDVDAGAGPAFVVMNERWTPQWKASIDGAPATLYRVNGLVRGVYVGPGRHVVRIFYRDGYFVAGAIVSLAAVIILLSVVLFHLFNRSGT